MFVTPHLADRVDRGLDIVERLGNVRKQTDASAGQRDAAMAAHEQLDVQCIFKLADGGTHRGLLHIHLGGGLGE